MGTRVFILVLLSCFVLSECKPGYLSYAEVKGKPYSVSYDKRSLRINNQPSLFLSGSIHPPRSTPAMWDDIFKGAINDGLNMVEVYVFWNFHEPTEGKINWEGVANLTEFIQQAANNNLFVNLRIGPYVCAEWEYGGIPTWLGFKDGVAFRDYNQVWLTYMQSWFNTVVNLLESQFPQNGGPIVLVQVENELHTTSPSGQKYITWCGQMAQQALSKTPVPVIMCNGNSAENTINTCNGNECTSFIEQHGQNGRILIDQPPMWTENEGGFQVWGGSPSKPTEYFWGRSTENIAYNILQWFARGGSHMNYYMYFGGNNYGHWPGASVTTMYASDVNICPDGFPHEPKHSHLNLLHSFISEYADVIANDQAQLGHQIDLLYYDNTTHKWEKGTQQIAFVYSNGGRSVVFIENQFNGYVQTQYNNVDFTLPPSSVSIVDGQNLKEVFNSAKVAPATVKRSDIPYPSDTPFSWVSWAEPISPSQTSKYPSTTETSPAEQSTITRGFTQYLWYSTNITTTYLQTATLSITTNVANNFLIFVDGVVRGTVEDRRHDGSDIVLNVTLGSLSAGTHDILILSESYGFPNDMAAGSGRKVKGITGKVSLDGQDITNGNWNMRPYLVGELEQIYSPQGTNNVHWSSQVPRNQAVTWYRTQFTLQSPIPKDQVLLFKPTGLGRGYAYINGFNLGLYYNILMNDNSGRYTQTFYHIPPDVLKQGTNLLVVGEVSGASSLSSVRLILRKMVPAEQNEQGFEDSGIQTCPM